MKELMLLVVAIALSACSTSPVRVFLHFVDLGQPSNGSWLPLHHQTPIVLWRSQIQAPTFLPGGWTIL